MSESVPRSANTGLLVIIVLILGGAVLYLAQTVLLPMVIGVFFTVLILPLKQFLERWIPPFLSLPIVLTLLVSVLVSGSAVVGASLVRVGQKMPDYAAKFESTAEEMVAWAAQFGLNISPELLAGEKVLGVGWDFLSSGLSSLFSGVGQLVLIVFITLFMLAETAQFGRKVRAAFSLGASKQILVTVHSIGRQVQRYVVAKTAISAGTGLCTWFICSILGLDFAFFWGMLAFLLNFVPNFGSIIAVIPPTIIAGLQTASWGWLILTGSLLASVQMTIGNVIEPRILGRSMSLSPLVVFLSMLFWGWLWGIIGVVLSVPLTVGIKILCEHVDSLRPIGVLLGEEPDVAELIPESPEDDDHSFFDLGPAPNELHLRQQGEEPIDPP